MTCQNADPGASQGVEVDLAGRAQQDIGDALAHNLITGVEVSRELGRRRGTHRPVAPVVFQSTLGVDAALGSEVVDFTSETREPTNTGQFVAAIDIAAFGDPAAYEAAAARVFAELRASPPLPGHDPVRIPGDGRNAAYAARKAKGLALHANLRRELDAIAKEFGVVGL